MLDLKKHLNEGYEQRIKDGVYQWMVDHSTVMDDGRLRVLAYIDGKENFWKRARPRNRKGAGKEEHDIWYRAENRKR